MLFRIGRTQKLVVLYQSAEEMEPMIAILSSHTLIEVITLLLPILAAMALREQFLRNNKVM